MNRDDKKIEGPYSREKFARESRNSWCVNGRGCGCIGTVDLDRFRLIIPEIGILTSGTLSIAPGLGPKVNPPVTLKPKLESLPILSSVEHLGEL